MAATSPNPNQIPPSDININLMDKPISPRKTQKDDDAKELDQDDETEEREVPDADNGGNTI